MSNGERHSVRRFFLHLDIFSRILVLVAAFLVLCIASGTLWAFLYGSTPQTGKRQSLFDKGIRNPARAEVITTDSEESTAVFGEIGLLRAVTADIEPATVVISVFLPYSSEDSAFQEELVQKTRVIRKSILAWFKARSLSSIVELGESGVKTELLREINSNLVLGQVRIIYFDEYMVL